jgi:DNA-binding SARP family transcriptional activator
VRFRILGPLEVRNSAGRVLTFSRRKQRLLLAILVLAQGRGVAVDRIVEWLWGDQPPRSATQNVYSWQPSDSPRHSAG